MKLTVLGAYGGVPAKNKACMGFLIQTDSCNLLLDCGSGVVSRLQNIIDLRDLDAVIITHLHNDHFSDLLVMQYAYEVGMKLSGFQKLDVYCPFEPQNKMQNLESDAFNLIQLHEGSIKIKDIALDLKKTLHNIETYAVRCTDKENSIGYTSDTGYTDTLIPFFKDVDILIGESSLLKSQKSNTPYHLTTEEVVELANKANVNTLLLSHFWYEINPQIYLEEALSCNPLCIVKIAEENKIYLKKAIYPGTFDPFTNGHLHIIKQAVEIFDEVIILIAFNSKKSKRKIDVNKMKKAIEETLKINNLVNVTVVIFNGLTARLAEREGAKYLIRGLRDGKDYEYEEKLAQINDEISGVKTLYLRAGSLGYLSSSAVMEIDRFDEDIVSNWVPSPIYKLLKE